MTNKSWIDGLTEAEETVLKEKLAEFRAQAAKADRLRNMAPELLAGLKICLPHMPHAYYCAKNYAGENSTCFCDLHAEREIIRRLIAKVEGE